MPTYASFPRRVLAYLIDKFIVGVVLSVFSMYALVPLGILGSFDAENFAQSPFFGLAVVHSVVWGMLLMVAQWLYYALMESSAKQATLGKMLLGIKVTDLSGQRLSFARATGRYFAKIISEVTVIGYVFMWFTAKKQNLHDLLADTVVVKA